MSETPSVSVVVCTRNRPSDLARCLASLEQASPPPLEVIVIDQSDAPGTGAARSPTGRVRHHLTSERGLSRARNAGIAIAAGDVVAFLDDDCTVEPGWVGDIAAVFGRHPNAAMAFGAVIDGVGRPDQYVPAYRVARERPLRGALAAARAHGIGAAMYVTMPAARSVGRFDVRLGAGGEFGSSEDWDYTFRVLATGRTIIESPTIRVVHHGGRSYADGSAANLLRTNAFSHGAVHAKLLRCREGVALVLVAEELWASIRLLRPLAPLTGKPTNAGRLVSYLRGLMAGFRAPLDRSERTFGEPSPGRTQRSRSGSRGGAETIRP